MENLFSFKHLGNDEKVKSLSKKFAAVVMAGVMGVSMVAPAVAAPGDVSTYNTSLYKNDKYVAAHPDRNLSMGDGAVLDTDYKEIDANNYRVTVHFTESFEAYLISSHLTEVQIDVNGDGNFDEVEGIDYDLVYGNNNTEAVVGCSFDATSLPTAPTKYNAKFTIAAGKMPIAAEGDIYILPPAKDKK